MSWRDDLNYGLAAFGLQIPASQAITDLAAPFTDAQGKRTALVAVAGAMLLLHFEKRHNPVVNDIGDALLYASSCMRAGYTRIQPVTKAGKLLGSILLTYGPSLAKADYAESVPTGTTQAEIQDTLQSILNAMEAKSVDGNQKE